MATVMLIVGHENDHLRVEDAERRYTELLNQPVPTITATATVRETATVRVTERASRSKAKRTVNVPKVDSSATLACIRKHESGGNYRAVSASGKFRGAYQMHRTYAPTWAKRAGQGSWSDVPVDQWPPAVQDAVAYDMGHGNRWAAWREHTSYSCPGF
jgi:hypothetical protein